MPAPPSVWTTRILPLSPEAARPRARLGRLGYHREMTRALVYRAVRLLLFAAILCGLAWGAVAWLPHLLEGDESTDDAGDRPPGFWNVERPTPGSPEGAPETEGPSAEERARLASLPYLSGRAPATAHGARGVVRFLRGRAFEGINLYNSGHAPEAILMDMEGHPLHRWRYPFERAFPGVSPTSDTAFFRRVKLLPNGVLAALYQTGGLVFLDRRSHLLGRCRGNFYNDFWLGDDGTGWTLAKTVASADGDAETLDDFLVELRVTDGGRQCEEVRRFSITRAFADTPFAPKLQPMAAAGDVLHSNTVARIERHPPGSLPAFAEGNLLISLRQVDLVAVVDPAKQRVVWAQRGPWAGQHEPSLLADGHLLLFDNRGLGNLISRVLEVDPRSGEITWSWPPKAGDLSSEIGGSCARLPNGDTLITSSVRGRAVEIDRRGEIVWEFLTPHRAGPDDSLIAMLFEVQRLPVDAFAAASADKAR